MEDENQSVPPLPGYAGALRVALEERDAYTFEHCDRVISLSLLLGGDCGLNSEELLTLKVAACFHDVGKIGIPDHILLKPGPLDDGEWSAMRTHSAIGERILRGWNLGEAERAAVAVRHHHEHFDGNGYPDGLAGSEIPQLSRIIAIADSYDAMTLRRAYHPARERNDVLQLMEDGSGTQFDPELLSRFLGLIDSGSVKGQ